MKFWLGMILFLGCVSLLAAIFQLFSMQSRVAHQNVVVAGVGGDSRMESERQAAQLESIQLASQAAPIVPAEEPLTVPQAQVEIITIEPTILTTITASTAGVLSSDKTVPQHLQVCQTDNNGCICPRNSRHGHRLGIIVPFRDGCSVGSQGGGRLRNLAEFIPYMDAFLSKKNIDYKIIVVDQIAKGLFNKGFLFNTGFLLMNNSFDYIALHDVDLVPENDENSYAFPDNGPPQHLCVTNSRTNYEPAYAGMVGGVLLMRTEQYDAVNGFANTYWTWGQEDDDMYNRIRGILGEVSRPSPSVGRYRALDHARVMGLDETKRFRDQRKELYDVIAAANSGKDATRAHVMKNGFRQVQYRIDKMGCRSDYEHYVVDYLNPDSAMEPC
jgi:hypothetical protein